MRVALGRQVDGLARAEQIACVDLLRVQRTRLIHFLLLRVGVGFRTATSASNRSSLLSDGLTVTVLFEVRGCGGLCHRRRGVPMLAFLDAVLIVGPESVALRLDNACWPAACADLRLGPLGQDGDLAHVTNQGLRGIRSEKNDFIIDLVRVDVGAREPSLFSLH